MTNDAMKDLEELGFEIEEGNHYKLTYYGNERYMIVLAKTSSDGRNGKNAASDMIKKAF